MRRGRPNAEPVIDLPGEIWRPAPDWEHRMRVSNLGRVASLARLIDHPRIGIMRVPETLMRPFPYHGYLRLSVTLPDRTKYVPVHRLVAKAFVPRLDPEADTVNHDDGNPLNNVATNLEWCTGVANTRHGRYVLQRGPMRLTPEQVLEGRAMHADGMRIVNLARRYALSYATAWNAFHPQGLHYRHVMTDEELAQLWGA